MYLLSYGRNTIVQQPYTYARRAQSVTRSLQWTQLAYGEDLKEIREYAQSLDGWARAIGLERWRIEGMKEHTGFEETWELTKP